MVYSHFEFNDCVYGDINIDPGNEYRSHSLHCVFLPSILFLILKMKMQMLELNFHAAISERNFLNEECWICQLTILHNNQ